VVTVPLRPASSPLLFSGRGTVKSWPPPLSRTQPLTYQPLTYRWNKGFFYCVHLCFGDFASSNQMASTAFVLATDQYSFPTWKSLTKQKTQKRLIQRDDDCLDLRCRSASEIRIGQSQGSHLSLAIPGSVSSWMKTPLQIQMFWKTQRWGHCYNPSTEEAEIKGSFVWGQPELHSNSRPAWAM
jgi:hypothetical protein